MAAFLLFEFALNLEGLQTIDSLKMLGGHWFLRIDGLLLCEFSEHQLRLEGVCVLRQLVIKLKSKSVVVVQPLLLLKKLHVFVIRVALDRESRRGLLFILPVE